MSRRNNRGKQGKSRASCNPDPGIRPKEHDLNDLVRGLERLFLSRSGNGLELKTRLADGTLNVMADAAMLERVLLSIMEVAKGGTSEKSRFIITTGQIGFSAGLAASGKGVDGMCAICSITKYGSPDEDTAKERLSGCFSISTASDGKCHASPSSIIKQHNGSFNVESVAGGVAVHVYLPLLGDPTEKDELILLPEPAAFVPSRHQSLLFQRQFELPVTSGFRAQQFS